MGDKGVGLYPLLGQQPDGFLKVGKGVHQASFQVRDVPALASGLAQVLQRDWDEAALARKFSRDWHQVAEDTLAACEEALAVARAPASALAH